MLDTPAAPRRSVGRLTFPGGMALTPDGRLAIASGNTVSRLIGGGSVFLLDTDTGAKTRVASRLVGANGLVRAADGTIYTSDEAASQIDRIGPDGKATLSWWHGSGGPSGLALTPDGRTLYAGLANVGRIVAIGTTTGATRTIFRTANPVSLPDGLALDAAGQLYVPLFLTGEVLRIDPSTGKACRLARGLTLPTSIAIAPAGGPFDVASVYVTSWGAVKRIAGAVVAGSIRPARTSPPAAP